MQKSCWVCFPAGGAVCFMTCGCVGRAPTGDIGRCGQAGWVVEGLLPLKSSDSSFTHLLTLPCT